VKHTTLQREKVGVGGDKISKDDMQGMLLDAEELLAAKR